MATGWSNQVGRDKYKVVLNEGKETEVSETDIPAVGDASNPSVSMQTVEVDDGELTLNIRYADNKTLCAVVNQIYIMYHGPRFSSWTYNMDLKESVQLTTENVENPENITGWLSDNPEVANVDEEGNVFATGVGNAKITAIYEGKSLQCTIAVTNENGVTVDYSVDAGEMNHVAGGNLHLYDDRSPAGWLSDGIGVYAVRGQNYSNRTSSEYEYLPGFFEEKTYNRLMEESPDAKLMIGLYYGYKGRTGGEWKKGAYDSGYMQMWAQNCVDIYNDAKEKEIDVYSWIPLNEPDLQWSGDDWDNDYPAKFFEVAYKAIKAIDPDARIQGPEMASSNMSRMRQFLTYCRDNDCLPDVLSWHDLRNGQSGIEGDVQTLTDWMENNGITPMPMAVTEYQGMGYSTDEAGRKAQGNYNTGLTISYLATLERSVDDGVIAGLRSEWGLPGSNSGARGDMGEMCDFDTKRMPTGLWYVYNAYWDMTGRKVQTEQNSSMLDALATIDLSLEKLQSGILIGNWKENDRLILLDLKNIPTELIVDKQIHIQVYALNETLATPCYGAVPVMDENVEVSGNSLALDLPISGRQACYVVLSQPYVTVNKTLVSDITPVLTGNMMAQIVGSGAQEYISITGGKTSSYVDAEGKETYRENGDSVTYTLSAEQDGVYNFTSKLVKDRMQALCSFI